MHQLQLVYSSNSGRRNRESKQSVKRPASYSRSRSAKAFGRKADRLADLRPAAASLLERLVDDLLAEAVK